MSTPNFKRQIERERENYARTCDLAIEKLDDLERAGIPPTEVSIWDRDWEFHWRDPNGNSYYHSCDCGNTRAVENCKHGFLHGDGSIGPGDADLDWEETVRALQLALGMEQP